MWEVNFLSTIEHSPHGSRLDTPNIDLNYGLGDHIQIKFEVPWVVKSDPGQRALSGLGNSIFGVKWRFFDQERLGIDISTYPQLEFNNPVRSAVIDSADRRVRLFLPVEAMKAIGRLEVDGEFGYRFVHFGPDEIEYGLAVGYHVSKRVELLGELHGSREITAIPDELFFNAGSRVRLTKGAALLVAVGRTLNTSEGGRRYLGALGVEFNFGGGLLGLWRR